MSLKAFHILFLISAVVLSIGFGVYSILHHADGAPQSYLIMGIISSVMGVALAIYSRFILRKLKHVSFF